MPHFVTGTVLEVLETRKGLQKLRVVRADGGEGDRAYVLTDVVGTANAGDAVILNVTAVDLQLGTGGWHVVHWNLVRSEFAKVGDGHVMKARYMSEQLDTGAGEETIIPSETLTGMPVVVCMLLSQAATAILAFKREAPQKRVAVLVTDQASLPVAFSDLLAALKTSGVIDVVISSGQAFGGDIEAVNIASGLCMAHASGVDVVFVTEGPGVVGTGSMYGFSAFEMAGVVDLVHKLKGTPYVAVRYSSADNRDRHRGVSHHTKTILRHCDGATVVIPQGEQMIATRDHLCISLNVGDVGDLLAKSGLNITTMGRSFSQDERFFQYAAAVGVAAARQ